MSGHRKEVGPEPIYIKSNPLSRFFPAGWKDIWFRRQAEADDKGNIVYACPICTRKFDHSMIDHLHGDHIWPYSLFGETTWENYQLICGDCNTSKSNALDANVRKALGAAGFRARVVRFLLEQVDAGQIPMDAVLKSIVSSIVKEES